MARRLEFPRALRNFGPIAAILLLPLAAWPQTGRSYAVLVGVSKYDDRGIQWLKYASRDADLFQSWLNSPGKSPQILQIEEGKATLPVVREALRDVLTVKAGPLDDVYLFFSGRGLGTPDYNAGFIFTSETEQSRPVSTALSTEELGLFIRQSQAKRVFLFADVCRYPDALHRNNLIQFKLKDIGKAKTPLSAILGSQPSQFSAELEDRKYGAFSYFLVEGLKSGQKTIQDLLAYLMKQLPLGSSTHQKPWEFGPLTAPLGSNGRVQTQLRPRFIRAAFTPSAEEQSDAFHNELMGALASDPDTAYRLFLSADTALQQQERQGFAIGLEETGQKVLVQYGQGDQFPNEPGRPGKREFQNAARAFELARNLQDDSALQVALDARGYFSQGRALLFDAKTPEEYAKAIGVLSSAIAKRDDYPESYNAIGIAHLERAEYPAALTAFNESIRRAPDWAYPRHNLALTYVETGDYALAEREYREAIRRTPYHPYLYYNLGVLLHRVNRKTDAKAEYKLAVRSFEEQAAVALDHANRWQADGDLAQNRKSLDRRATLLKNEAEVHNALGALEQAQRNVKGAKSEYEAARQLNPDLLLAPYNLGVLEAKKDPDAAIRLWRETLAKDPDFVPSRMMLADAYQKQRKFVEAAAEYQAVLRLQPASDAKDRLPEVLGDLKAAAGNSVEACSQYRLVKGVSPEHKRALARKISGVCK